MPKALYPEQQTLEARKQTLTSTISQPSQWRAVVEALQPVCGLPNGQSMVELSVVFQCDASEIGPPYSTIAHGSI